ncbi:uncharacterized protein C8A04DRAFT_9944 [Dichotomopilus funicola]|uniref:Uncharacterized protein n=1 Tax=Dichotomopilus funicola TaxID=1934379 RepID=A0AAN6V7K0_9PEZI|nr:hypothetical protein C8A04DRAFT_9944 [Dichotomopilus funicola]
MEPQALDYRASSKHCGSAKHVKQSIGGSLLSASEPAQSWTATRCHRLLRPLLAHISALRKEKERRTFVQVGAVSGSISTSRPATKSRRNVLGKRSYPSSDSDYKDERKTYRKYSRKTSRRRRSSSSSDQSATPQRNVQRQRRQPGPKGPQDVVLPTPFLRRVRNHQLSSPAKAPYDAHEEEPVPASSRCSHSGGSCKTKCAYAVELAGFRPIVDSARHGLYESVFKSFDAILRVTSPRGGHTKGPRSLMAMCLRKVPAYIAGIEEWERQEAEENGTKAAVQGAGMSFKIYSELESLGAVDGWTHLCLLLRAHAVQIIRDAVAEELMEDLVTGLFVRVCLEYMPSTECTDLIETFVVRQYPKPVSPDDDLFASSALRPLSTLRACDPTGKSILPRILTKLFANDLLPVDWVLNKTFKALWPSTIRHITHTKPCDATLGFTITTLELLCALAFPRKPRGVPQKRLQGRPQLTLVSAIAALGSVILLSEEGSAETTETPTITRTTIIQRRIRYITSTFSANLKRRKAPTRKLGVYLLALCSLLSLSELPASSSETSTAPASSTVEAAWANVQSCHNDPALLLQYDATTALMSAMAHHCSRGTGLPPHFYLTRFCDKLETLGLPTNALSNMRVDGALKLAELTGDLRDLEMAEGLRKKQVTEPAQITPARSGGKGRKPKSFSGIRWDDGISEWLAATPGSEIRAAPADKLRRSSRFIAEDDNNTERSESEASVDGDDTDVDHDQQPTPDESDTSSTNSDTDSEGEDNEEEHNDTTLSPNTEASPVSNCKQASIPKPSAPTPPLPQGSFLAARPRRLSRPFTITRARDELAFDTITTTTTTTAFTRSIGPSGTGRSSITSTNTNRRLARASLVYMQPNIGVRVRNREGGNEKGDLKRRKSEGVVRRVELDVDGSDDELSFI